MEISLAIASWRSFVPIHSHLSILPHIWAHVSGRTRFSARYVVQFKWAVKRPPSQRRRTSAEYWRNCARRFSLRNWRVGSEMKRPGRKTSGSMPSAGGLICRTCMREWVLTTKENAQSSDYCGCSTRCGPERQALDLPTRWSGLYSPRAPRQLRHSAPWEHVRTYDLLVCT